LTKFDIYVTYIPEWVNISQLVVHFESTKVCIFVPAG